MIETGGPVVFNSFLDFQQPLPLAATATTALRSSNGGNHEIINDNISSELLLSDLPPSLVAIVVAADASHAAEARQAVSKLERVGHQLQLAWIEDEQLSQRTQRQLREDGGATG